MLYFCLMLWKQDTFPSLLSNSVLLLENESTSTTWRIGGTLCEISAEILNCNNWLTCTFQSAGQSISAQRMSTVEN